MHDFKNFKVRRALADCAAGVVALFALATTNSALQAQEVAAPADQCELHVFPVFVMMTNDVTQNNMGGLIPELLNGLMAIRSPEEIAAFLRSSVPVEDELQMLRSVDYSATVRGANTTVIVHDQPYRGEAIAGSSYLTSPPVVENPATCHREIILSAFYYEKGSLSKSLKTTYFYRDYRDGVITERGMLGVEASGIRNFPPENPDEMAAARQSVRDAYLANFIDALNQR